MYSLFAGLEPLTPVETTSVLLAQKLAEKERKQKRDALYDRYTPMVYDVLDLLIAAYRPGIWKKGSDSDHEFCCHCRWYAGPEETGRAHYDDHPIRRWIEIELEVDDLCAPTGFKVLCHHDPSRCVHVGLDQSELARGIKAVLY